MLYFHLTLEPPEPVPILKQSATIASAFLLAVPACATLGRLTFENPTITLDRIVLERIDLSGGRLGLVFQVHNPNAFQVRGTGLEVDLALEDVPFGNVTLTDPLSLPANETTAVRVPLEFFWSGVGAGAQSLLDNGSVRYAVDGGLRVDTPYGTGRVPYRRSGTVSLVDRRSAAERPGR